MPCAVPSYFKQQPAFAARNSVPCTPSEALSLTKTPNVLCVAIAQFVISTFASRQICTAGEAPAASKLIDIFSSATFFPEIVIPGRCPSTPRIVAVPFPAAGPTKRALTVISQLPE